MADSKITALDENTTPVGTDILPIVDDPSGTAKTEKITLDNLLGALNAQRGFLINGKIVPSVASDNLTVAIKGLDGNDPSASNPVYCRIGDTIRSITAALSVTKNAATNWFASGSTELATKEIDYFVYLGYNATDGVVIGFSRIPYAQEYSEFSATTTNEKYCAISTITNAAAGDDYEVVGRFAATLSAGAGYTWSVPTFSNINLVQRPIYETRWLNCAPVITTHSFNSITAIYKVNYRTVFFDYGYSVAITGTPSNYLVTLPISGVETAQYSFVASGSTNDLEKSIVGVFYGTAVNQMYIKKVDGTNFTAGTSSLCGLKGFYKLI